MSYSLDTSGTLKRRQADTEAAVPHDRARPHGRHEQHREYSTSTCSRPQVSTDQRPATAQDQGQKLRRLQGTCGGRPRLRDHYCHGRAAGHINGCPTPCGFWARRARATRGYAAYGLR